MAQANCKGCQNRHVGCHGTCSIYQEYKKKQDALLRAKNLYKEADALLVQRTIDKATMHAKKKKARIK